MEQRTLLEDEVEFEIEDKRNLGERVLRTSVVGIYQSREEVRFEVVKDRKAGTIIPLIRRFVGACSWIVTNEWKVYSSIKKEG